MIKLPWKLLFGEKSKLQATTVLPYLFAKVPITVYLVYIIGTGFDENLYHT